MAYYLVNKEKDKVTGYSTLPLLLDQNPGIGESQGYIKEMFIVWFSKAVGNTKWESNCGNFRIYEGKFVQRERKKK